MGLAILVGLVGMVVPVLPGSLLIAAAVLVWALDTQHAGAWAVLALVVVLLVAGKAATYLVTGQRVTASGVPQRSLLVAALAGVVGFFVLPVVGLFVFFPLALYGMEYQRLKDPVRARSSAWTAVKATVLGSIVELAFALAAAGAWLVAVVVFQLGPQGG